MARRVFFSFHYGRDVWRANVVRNSWVTKPDRVSAGFFDAGLWEEAKQKGDVAIRKLIDDALIGTTVTAVLIGQYTSSRRYVAYEIEQSIKRGNGLLGVHIERIENSKGETDSGGSNPLASGYSEYWWFADKGYENFGQWVEAAAKAAGK